MQTLILLLGSIAAIVGVKEVSRNIITASLHCSQIRTAYAELDDEAFDSIQRTTDEHFDEIWNTVFTGTVPDNAETRAAQFASILEERIKAAL